MSKNPFILLGDLNRRLLNLMNAIDYIRGSKLEERLKELYRESFIMQLLSNQYVIAIAGMQGAGKSSLIRQYYELPDDILPANQGRGEMLPVLITETDSPDKRFFAYELEPTSTAFVVQKKQITNEEFKAKSIQIGQQALLLEIEVNQKILKSDDRHFLLLPGFQSNDDYFKELTWSALRAASTCVVVFFENGYANVANRELIECLSKDFHSAKPVYALTMADQSKDGNQQLRSRVIKDLQIDTNETDRVQITSNQEPLSKIWPVHFSSALSKYAANDRSFLRVQLENLDGFLNRLSALLDQISGANDTKVTEAEVKEYRNVKMIYRVFQEEIAAYRKELDIRLREEFDPIKARVGNLINENIGEKKWWNLIVENWFTNPIKVKQEMRKLIEDAFAKEPFSLDQHFVFCLNKVQNRRLVLIAPGVYTLPEKETNDKQYLLSGDNSANTPENRSLFSADVKNDLLILANPTLTNDFSEKLEHSIRLLPALTFELLRMAVITPQVFAKGQKDLFTSDVGDHDLLRNYQQNKREYAIMAAVLLGMDVLPDGQFDLFDIIQMNVTGAGGSAAASGGAAVAGIAVNWAAAALLSGVVLTYIINKMHDSARMQSAATERIIGQMIDYAAQQCLDRFDTAMADLGNIVVERLRDRYGISQQIGQTQIVYDRIKEVHTKLREIRGGLNEYRASMGIPV